MNIPKKMIAVVLLAALANFSTPVLTLAATCQGMSCNGKDPQLTGCWRDAVTINISRGSTRGTIGGNYLETVELRYSKACKAQWARVFSVAPSWSVLRTEAYMASDINVSRVVRVGRGPVWSKMVPSVQDIGGACGKTILRNSEFLQSHCINAR